jgi:2-iminobutanoate/2-iminopropanoate deaminase
MKLVHLLAGAVLLLTGCTPKTENTELLINEEQDMKKAISTEKAPAAIGPYSQAIEANGFVYASGQLPIDPATGQFPEGGIKEQTRQSILNAQAILEAAGLTLANVVKTTVFLADMNDFAAMNEVYASFFQAPYPARSAVAVKTLPKGAMVEIECIAALQSE